MSIKDSQNISFVQKIESFEVESSLHVCATFLDSGYSLKILGTRSVLDFLVFCMLEYLHIHEEITWEWDPCLNAKFIYIS